MDDGGHSGEQPLVGSLADGEDVVAGGRQAGPAGLEDAAHADFPKSLDRDVGEPLGVARARRHASEADEHRRVAAFEEVDQVR
jgi:hypothetical protein